jgi:hypothetical protein
MDPTVWRVRTSGTAKGRIPGRERGDARDGEGEGVYLVEKGVMQGVERVRAYTWERKG